MIRAAAILCALSLPSCVALPTADKGKARANREYWVVSYTFKF